MPFAVISFLARIVAEPSLTFNAGFVKSDTSPNVNAPPALIIILELSTLIFPVAVTLPSVEIMFASEFVKEISPAESAFFA